jgi:hypothetical protein
MNLLPGPKLPSMKNTCLDGLSYWGVYQPDRRIDFNGFHWASPAGGVLIDPMELDQAGLQELSERGGARWILITNAEHMRAGPALKGALGATLLAPAEERERLGDLAEEVDGWFSAEGGLPEELSSLIEVHAMRGGKSPMEPALHLKPLEAIYFADLVRSHESGRLRLLPDPKISDRAEVLLSLRGLEDLTLQAILLGDGDGIYNGAAEAFSTLLMGD